MNDKKIYFLKLNCTKFLYIDYFENRYYIDEKFSGKKTVFVIEDGVNFDAETKQKLIFDLESGWLVTFVNLSKELEFNIYSNRYYYHQNSRV